MSRQIWKSLALLALGTAAVTLSALVAWSALNWLTTGANATSDVSQLLGAALGASLTVGLTFWLTENSAKRKSEQGHRQLMRQVRQLAMDAEKLNADHYPDPVTDLEAADLCKQLVLDCERLREGLQVFDFTMQRGVDESYDVLADIFRVRRSMEFLTEPGTGNGNRPPLLLARDRFERSEDVLDFQHGLVEVSKSTESLRQRLNDLLNSLNANRK